LQARSFHISRSEITGKLNIRRNNLTSALARMRDPRERAASHVVFSGCCLCVFTHDNERSFWQNRRLSKCAQLSQFRQEKIGLSSFLPPPNLGPSRKRHKYED
jgi:hypothetical protein